MTSPDKSRHYVHGMKRLLGIGLLALAAQFALDLAQAQAPMTLPSAPKAGNQAQNGPNPSQYSVYAPSDIAAASSGATDNRKLRARRGALLGPSLGTERASAEGTPNLPRLCFEPGVGWITAPAVTPSREDNSKRESPDESRPGSNPGLPIQHGVMARAKPRESTECPPVSLSLGADIDAGQNISAGDSDSMFMNPSLKPNADLSQYNSFQSWLSDRPTSGTVNSAPLKSAFDLPGGLRSSGIHAPTDPDSALAELKALRHRGYVSDVKLRRLSRNPQNLEARLELRRMNSEVVKRKRSKQAEEAKRNANGNKHVSSTNLLAKKAECDKKPGASKSKVCSVIKKVM